jgi:hypothetical protein
MIVVFPKQERERQETPFCLSYSSSLTDVPVYAAEVVFVVDGWLREWFKTIKPIHAW